MLPFLKGYFTFFEKMNKFDKLLARLTKQKINNNQITNIENKRWDLSTDCIDIKSIIKKQLHVRKLDNLAKMVKSLERQKYKN